MKPSKTFLLTLIALFMILPLAAQLTIDAEIRPRGEFRNGFKRPRPAEADPAFFIEQRSRIYLGYRAERLRLQLNLQDVRIWGNVDQIYKSDPALTNLHEGWGEFFFNPRVSVKLGRQEIDYDNARFLGDLRWAAQSRSHDAVILKYEHDSLGWKVHLGGAFNQNVPFEPGKLEGTFYSGVNNYKTMLYLWANRKGPWGQLSFLAHNDGRQVARDSSVAHRQTLGLFGDCPLTAGLSLRGELYYQTGKDPARRDLSAIMATAYLSYKPNQVTYTVGGEYLSGTAPNEQEENHAFNPLYGTNHKFYGYMDYFYVGNNHGQNGNTAGLIDINARGKFPIGPGNLEAKVHNFLSPVEVLDPEQPGNTLSRQLGVEVDLVYTVNVVRALNVQGGYSQMFGTPSLEALKGGGAADKFNNWIWLMVTFKPRVYEGN